MTKHINRVSKDTGKSGREDAEDEWSHITGVGSKIEAADAMDVTDRAIFFSSKQIPSTKQEIVQEKSEEIKDQMSNTNQYMRFANVLLRQRADDLKKMLEKEKKFADELNCFQDAPKSRFELESLNPKYIGESDAKSLINNLELEYNKMKEKLDYEQSIIEKTKSELVIKKQQIEQLKEELKFIIQRQKKETEIDDPVQMIKHELRKLGVSDDAGNIAKALQILASKLNKS
ncbi:hypothetical protein [Candidatus Nitrosotenuis cloacae]|uniref:hypothetical protein n=1 Tax=Candidatus Nitrosotenuis cloacae TaxID=1603555 RepID=UPI0022801140|nr:hypothetical protein [Candidatus Nitrosotenuis cloacae]